MESILLICGVAVAFLLNIAVLKKRDIIESIVLAVVSYFSCYIVVSGLLFWGDNSGRRDCAWNGTIRVVTVSKEHKLKKYAMEY